MAKVSSSTQQNGYFHEINAQCDLLFSGQSHDSIVVENGVITYIGGRNGAYNRVDNINQNNVE